MRSSTLAVLALLALASACGGASTAAEPLEPRAARRAAPPAPLEIDITSERVGSALRFDVSVLGRGREEGAAFEDPDRWSITARQNGRALSRLVNGSVEVDRLSSGSQWDTVVKFNLVFEIADSSPVKITLVPPGAPPIERELDPGEAPVVEPTPEGEAGDDATPDAPGATPAVAGKEKDKDKDKDKDTTPAKDKPTKSKKTKKTAKKKAD